MTNAPALDVDGLRVDVAGTDIDIVDSISFQVATGEVLGVVGESGSGKTTVGLAVLGHARRGARIVAGEIRIGGENILARSPAQLRSLRGRIVSYVPQDPSASLNPSRRIEPQLMEMLESHGFGSSKAERRSRLAEMLEEVLFPNDREFLRRYPHQLSGGQTQRVVLAMAFACRPHVIVLDEPTTGLDVTTQAHVLNTVRDLCERHGVAAVYISHDLAVIAGLAHRVAVMYAGRIVEAGPQWQLFSSAAHPYTRKLVDAIPNISGRYELVGIPGRAPAPGRRPPGCFFAPRCELADDRSRAEFPPVTVLSDSHTVRCFRSRDVLAGAARQRVLLDGSDRRRDGGQSLIEISGLHASYGDREVVHDVALVVRPHECLALVGQSGTGKTTVARCIAGLHRQYTGEVRLENVVLPRSARDRDSRTRRAIQYIFQNPYSSVNPRKTVGQIIVQPLRLFFELSRREARSRVLEALERVSLAGSLIDQYPDQLSGGERQRVAIARALATEPSLLVCDEITSALDVSVQASIVELLGELQREMGLGLLFVTHNLPLIRTIAQHVIVMNEGRIVESGTVESVLGSPQEAYTQNLLRDTPTLDGVLAAH